MPTSTPWLHQLAQQQPARPVELALDRDECRARLSWPGRGAALEVGWPLTVKVSRSCRGRRWLRRDTLHVELCHGTQRRVLNARLRAHQRSRLEGLPWLEVHAGERVAGDILESILAVVLGAGAELAAWSEEQAIAPWQREAMHHTANRPTASATAMERLDFTPQQDGPADHPSERRQGALVAGIVLLAAAGVMSFLAVPLDDSPAIIPVTLLPRWLMALQGMVIPLGAIFAGAILLKRLVPARIAQIVRCPTTQGEVIVQLEKSSSTFLLRSRDATSMRTLARLRIASDVSTDEYEIPNGRAGWMARGWYYSSVVVILGETTDLVWTLCIGRRGLQAIDPRTLRPLAMPLSVELPRDTCAYAFEPHSGGVVVGLTDQRKILIHPHTFEVVDWSSRS